MIEAEYLPALFAAYRSFTEAGRLSGLRWHGLYKKWIRIVRKTVAILKKKWYDVIDIYGEGLRWNQIGGFFLLCRKWNTIVL